MNGTFVELPTINNIKAAFDWLETGDWQKAHNELMRIEAQTRTHPLVLELQFQIYTKAQMWDCAAEVSWALTEILPDHSMGWVQWAYSLHEMNRTKDAKCILTTVVERFPQDYLIQYNLASYCYELGDDEEATRWMEGARKIAQENQLFSNTVKLKSKHKSLEKCV